MRNQAPAYSSTGNGDIYLGEWETDSYSGEGIYIRKDGERYEGQMRKGHKWGQGIYYYADGRVYKGKLG